MEAIRSFEHEGERYVAVDYNANGCSSCAFIKECKALRRGSMDGTIQDCYPNYPPNEDREVSFLTEVDYLKRVMRQA